MKLIIAGSRSIRDYSDVRDGVVASGLWKAYRASIEVVSGTAKGVDLLGEQFAEKNGLLVHRFPAKWNDFSTGTGRIAYHKYGKYNPEAGMIRNMKMGLFADELLAIWDTKSTGTGHMVSYMKELGKPVHIHIPERFL